MGTLQIEPVAWSVSVDTAPPSQVVDELHIAQNQRRVEKTIDFWIREKSFAAVLSGDWVASPRYGIDGRTGRIVWQTKPYFPKREWNDKRRRQTVERQVNPIAVQSGEIIGQSGVVLSTQTGHIVRREKRKPIPSEEEQTMPVYTGEYGKAVGLINDLKSPPSDIRRRLEMNGIGTLLHGTAENAYAERQNELDVPAFPPRRAVEWIPKLHAASPREWFLRCDDGNVSWTWDTRNLSERLGDETIMQTRRLKIYAPYLFYLHCVSAVDKEPEEEWEAIAAPFIVFVVAQDLRNGSITSLRQVGKEPIIGPMLEAVDENGLLIRSFDRRLFYLPVTFGG